MTRQRFAARFLAGGFFAFPARWAHLPSAVADEVRGLAAKSAGAAQDTSNLISRSIQSAKTGTKSTGLAASAMQQAGINIS